jgi:hypothetical protein
MGVLHQQSHDATCACANTKGGNKNASGNLDAEGYDGKGSLYDECDSDHTHDAERLLARIKYTQALVGIR